MKIIGKIVSLLLILGLLAGCSASNAPSTDSGLTPVRLILDWTPSTNHTGIYMAKALGYYKEMGIDLEILQPPESGALPLLAAGNAEYAISFQESLGPALASSDPLPVKAIAGIISHNTSGIISLKEKNILSPKDLEGKRVFAWDSPLVQGIIKQLVEEDGGDFSKVELVYNNVTDAASALQADADAVWVFYAWDGVAIKVAGLETNYFNISDYNPTFDFYTPVIATNNTYAKENPKLVKDFLSATTKGYEYAMANPEEAAKKYVEIVPELNADMVLEGQLFLADQYQSDAPRWGEIDESRWATFYDWMYDTGILDNPLGSEGFTNEFLPLERNQ